jgi:hypothetical protein
MIHWNPFFQRHIAEHPGSQMLILSSHPCFLPHFFPLPAVAFSTNSYSESNGNAFEVPPFVSNQMALALRLDRQSGWRLCPSNAAIASTLRNPIQVKKPPAKTPAAKRLHPTNL